MTLLDATHADVTGPPTPFLAKHPCPQLFMPPQLFGKYLKKEHDSILCT